jgi:secondary thiamine-phosphate synthase enzyme
MITECAEFARSASGGGDGLLHVFVPHATAGVALLEVGSGSDADLLSALASLLPADDRWRHAHGSRGHGRSHVMPALVAPYATIPVLGGRLALGTWQSIALVDLNVDNPDRQVRLSFLQLSPGGTPPVPPGVRAGAEAAGRPSAGRRHRLSLPMG